MQWTDEGIVLGVKRHGEANAIAELFTREHGRHLGLVRGGFGTRLKPVLQPGNTVWVRIRSSRCLSAQVRCLPPVIRCLP
jgi:DNA repair protein RecO (recombination protein O)